MLVAWDLSLYHPNLNREKASKERMGRAPCCEKMGLKRGPWSLEEDQLLISYIQQHGHPNWRALPKHAGNYV